MKFAGLVAGLSAAGLLALGCSEGNVLTAAPRVRAVYWWKTDLDWTNDDAALLEREGVATIYLRLFDWDQEGGREVEAGPLKVENPLPEALSVVPVVYVTVKTLQTWAKTPLDVSEAGKREAEILLKKIDARTARAWRGRAAEIQIDADWSPSTRVAYFAVLEALRQKLHERKETLSATVRLHQFRDRETQGVPPVDRAVLLPYAAADPRDPASESVLDPKLVAMYVRPDSPAYPLPFDLALPEYAQIRQFNPFYRLVALARVAPSSADFPGGTKEITGRGESWRQVLHSERWAGLFLMPGDIVQLDVPQPESWTKTLAAALRARWGRGDPKAKIVVFDYDRGEWRSKRHEAFWKALHP